MDFNATGTFKYEPIILLQECGVGGTNVKAIDEGSDQFRWITTGVRSPPTCKDHSMCF